MLAPLLGSIARLVPVRLARTEEERRAVWRLRYRIYVGEQHDVVFPDADHERRELRAPDDERPETRLYYTGALPDLDGTVTVQSFAPGALPAAVRARFCLGRFPDVDSRSSCMVSFLRLNPTRGGRCSGFDKRSRRDECWTSQR